MTLYTILSTCPPDVSRASTSSRSRMSEGTANSGITADGEFTIYEVPPVGLMFGKSNRLDPPSSRPRTHMQGLGLRAPGAIRLKPSGSRASPSPMAPSPSPTAPPSPPTASSVPTAPSPPFPSRSSPSPSPSSSSSPSSLSQARAVQAFCFFVALNRLRAKDAPEPW